MLVLRFRLILGLALIATSVSLWFPRWHASPTSEEGAFALWGFPAPMVRSGLFYANYFSQDRPRNWLERKAYMYQYTHPTDQPQVYAQGIALNFLTYVGLGTGLMTLIRRPKR